MAGKRSQRDDNRQDYPKSAVSEKYDLVVEDAYWREQYLSRPYYDSAFKYDHYRLAYQSGWEAFDAESNHDWATREAIARQYWESVGGPEYMTWDNARPAAMDAYERLTNPRSVETPQH